MDIEKYCRDVLQSAGEPDSITAIIPTRNRTSELIHAVNSISDTVNTIIIVDNDSEYPHDTACSVISKLFNNVKTIKLRKNLGPIVAQNIGASDAKTEWLLFMDNDAECIRWDFPTILPSHTAVIMPYVNDCWDSWMSGDPDKPHYLGSFHGCCVFIRKDVFDSVGGFNEDYFAYYHEPDFAAKIMREGWDIFYWPYARFIHHTSTVERDYSKIEYWLLKNHFIFSLKCLPFHIALYQCARWFIRSIYKATKYPRSILRGYRDLLPCIIPTLRNRTVCKEEIFLSHWKKLIRKYR